MAESTPIREEIASRELTGGPGTWERAWERLKLGCARSIFWVYERGSWQYDIICALILAFIFLTPRSVFNDRPTFELTDLRHVQGVVEVGRTADGWHYIVDSRLVESLAPKKPDEAIREILQRRLHKPFTVQSVEPLRDRHNVLLGYTVVVSQ